MGATIRIGYLRGAGDEESIGQAVTALETAGCVRVVIESGARRTVGPAYSSLIKRMSPGDTMVVVGLDHLSTSLPQLVDRLAELLDRDIDIETLAGDKVHIDRSVGDLIHQMQALPRRSRNGRADGVRERAMGRPRRLGAADIARARQLIESTGRPIEDVAREMGVSRATLYRNLRNA